MAARPEEEREYRHEQQAQLVDRRVRRVPDLERPEVTYPGRAGREPREHQEEPRSARKVERIAPLAGNSRAIMRPAYRRFRVEACVECRDDRFARSPAWRTSSGAGTF